MKYVNGTCWLAKWMNIALFCRQLITIIISCEGSIRPRSGFHKMLGWVLFFSKWSSHTLIIVRFYESTLLVSNCVAHCPMLCAQTVHITAQVFKLMTRYECRFGKRFCPPCGERYKLLLVDPSFDSSIPQPIFISQIGDRLSAKRRTEFHGTLAN